jgi:serine/threonine protein kinase
MPDWMTAPPNGKRRGSVDGMYSGARMGLTSGTKLCPYEIQSPIGAGGTGEVYRTKDMRLDRTVAIKILPSHLSENPEAKQHFGREARTISSLNHPNICTLYDVGRQDSIDYLLMEYLAGETLAAKAQINRYGTPTVTELQSSNDLFFPLLAFPGAKARRAKIRNIGYGVRSDFELNFGRYLPDFGQTDDDETNKQPG